MKTNQLFDMMPQFREYYVYDDDVMCVCMCLCVLSLSSFVKYGCMHKNNFFRHVCSRASNNSYKENNQNKR